jgi:hypothetical protein
MILGNNSEVMGCQVSINPLHYDSSSDPPTGIAFSDSPTLTATIFHGTEHYSEYNLEEEYDEDSQDGNVLHF